MKMKSIIFALAMLFSVTAFCQKAIISYAYSFKGNPLGFSGHYFIPKSKFGVFASFSWVPKTNSPYKDAKHVVDPKEWSDVFPDYSTRKDVVYHASMLNVGGTYSFSKKFFVQLGAGQHLLQTYQVAEWRDWAALDPQVRKVNITIGASYLPLKWLRTGIGFDTAPKTIKAEIGFVIR